MRCWNKGNTPHFIDAISRHIAYPQVIVKQRVIVMTQPRRCRLAMVAIINENYDKITLTLNNLFKPIFQSLAQLLLYGSAIGGVGLFIYFL